MGSYKILGAIGEGGMGMVYRARHQNDSIASRQGGDVALKVMHPQYARNPELRARFDREDCKLPGENQSNGEKVIIVPLCILDPTPNHGTRVNRKL
jgi:serine/threonine protein kinase